MNAAPPDRKVVEVTAYQLFLALGRGPMLAGRTAVKESPDTPDHPTQWRNDAALRQWWREFATKLIVAQEGNGLKIAVGKPTKLEQAIRTMAIEPARQAYSVEQEVTEFTS